MAVSTADFEAMTPTPYSQARAGLRTGDILLFHSHNFPDDAIELATHSLWCHAAFVWRLADIDRLILLESVDKVGVRAAPLSTRINGSTAHPKPYPGKLLVLRHPRFPTEPHAAQIAAMTAFALDRLGDPYSPAELVKIAERIAAGIAGITLPGRLEPKNGFICSEYVAKCYEVIGLPLAPDKEGFIAPADIANDPEVYAVYSLVPDPPGEAAAEPPPPPIALAAPPPAEAEPGPEPDIEPQAPEPEPQAPEPEPEPAPVLTALATAGAVLHAPEPVEPRPEPESGTATFEAPNPVAGLNLLMLLAAVALVLAAAFIWKG